MKWNVETRQWNLPTAPELFNRLACTAISMLVVALLAFYHYGLDRTGTRLIRAGFAADPDLNALHTAIAHTDQDDVRKLLREPGLALNGNECQGRTRLSRVSGNRWVQGCRLLLERGADAVSAGAAREGAV